MAHSKDSYKSFLAEFAKFRDEYKHLPTHRVIELFTQERTTTPTQTSDTPKPRIRDTSIEVGANVPRSQNIPIRQRLGQSAPSYAASSTTINVVPRSHPVELSTSYNSYQDTQFDFDQFGSVENQYTYVRIDEPSGMDSFGLGMMPAQGYHDLYASSFDSEPAQIDPDLLNPSAPGACDMSREPSGSSLLAGDLGMLRMNSQESHNGGYEASATSAPTSIPQPPLLRKPRIVKPAPSPKRKSAPTPPPNISPPNKQRSRRSSNQPPLAPATAQSRPRASTTPYVRPKHPRKKCPHCPTDSEGFRGEHELRRHYDRVHASQTRRYIVRDLSADGKFLANCRACSSGRTYGVDYNATAHLKRQHFNEEKNPGVKVPENLREWVEVKLVDRSEELENEAEDQKETLATGQRKSAARTKEEASTDRKDLLEVSITQQETGELDWPPSGPNTTASQLWDSAMDMASQQSMWPPPQNSFSSSTQEFNVEGVFMLQDNAELDDPDMLLRGTHAAVMANGAFDMYNDLANLETQFHRLPTERAEGLRPMTVNLAEIEREFGQTWEPMYG